MPCCGGAACACKVSAGEGITVTGSGSAADPLVVSAEEIEVLDNTTFNLELVDGMLTVNFAATATLNDLPDVTTPAPTNGQVLGWDSPTSQWTARAPTTAASGSVLHDTSLNGDGSAGNPLVVAANAARMLATIAAGLGLTDTAMNQLVRHFVDVSARNADTVPLEVNAMSMLNVAPGLVDYWNGSAWVPLPGLEDTDQQGELLAMSGSYPVNGRTKRIIRQVSESTDVDGVFEVLSADDLAGLSGVVSCQFQETGDLPYKAVVAADTDRIIATAYRLDDGEPYPDQPVTGTVIAWAY